MKIDFKLDTSRFDTALAQYVQTTKKDLAEIVNQRALNIAGRAFDMIPPRSGGADAQRRKVRAYLTRQLSQRIRFTAKGKSTRRDLKRYQLQLRNLIVQARRRKAGKPGLYGVDMIRAAGAFLNRATNSVGFLKSVFLPIIRTLNPLVPFKFPWRKTHDIARWPNSAGYGFAAPATPSNSPVAILRIGVNLKKAPEGRPREILTTALQLAINLEARELTQHVERKMQQTANRFNARR